MNIAPLVKALRRDYPTWTLTAQVRRRGALSDAELEARIGTVSNIVEVADWSEFETIKRISSQHDIVINAGNSFTAAPVTAIVAGLRERAAAGNVAKLIHISGGGNFIDHSTSGNLNPDSKVWNVSKTIHGSSFQADLPKFKRDILYLPGVG